MQDTGGGAHRISAIEFDTSGCAAHRHRRIAVNKGERLLFDKLRLKRCKVRCCVIVARPRNGVVCIYHRLSLALQERARNDVLKYVQIAAHHFQSDTEHADIQHQLLPVGVIRQLFVGDGAQLDVVAFRCLFDIVAVIDNRAAGCDVGEMLLQTVPVQRDNQIELVAVVRYWFGANSDGEEGVSAADKRLVSTIGENVQAVPGTDLAHAFTNRIYPLAGRATYSDYKVVMCHLGSLHNFEVRGRYLKVTSRYRRRAYNCFVFYPEPAVASRSGEKIST